MSAALVPVAFLALLCIDGWLKKAIAAYDRRTAALAVAGASPSPRQVDDASPGCPPTP